MKSKNIQKEKNGISRNRQNQVVIPYHSNNTQISSNYNSNKLHISNNNQYLNLFINYSSSIINDVLISNNVKDKESLDITRDNPCIEDSITSDICAQNPLFFINRNIIKIPTKIEYVLRKYTPKKLLKAIHPDINVAVELCLLFTTQLTSTYFEGLHNPKKERWKSLHAKHLRELLSINSKAYKRVIKALEHPTSKGAILECDYKHIEGKKNYYYRFREAYVGKGMLSYHLQTKEAQRLLNKHFIRISGKSKSNPIVQNLIHFYESISLPTIDQIWEEGDKLIKQKHRTKKGKLIKKLGKHPRSYFKDLKSYSFVEDSIKIFKYLTEDGLMYPEIGSEKSGGRIVDSFTLMPSWIRRMIKVNGEAIVEADYSCLHPNIAISLYGGSKQHLTHFKLAMEISMDVNTIKVEHLSFFNKKVWQMKKSPLFKYYEKNEPTMLKNIINEKYSSEFKHRITSRKLFAKEVEIMNEVVKELNAKSIYVGYVYDALICSPSDVKKVKGIMDDIILKQGVKTSTKLSDEAFIPSFVDAANDSKYITVDFKQINSNIPIMDKIRDEINNGKEVVFEDAIIRFDDKDYYYDKVLKVDDKMNPELIYVAKSQVTNQ